MRTSNERFCLNSQNASKVTGSEWQTEKNPKTCHNQPQKRRLAVREDCIDADFLRFDHPGALSSKRGTGVSRYAMRAPHGSTTAQQKGHKSLHSKKTHYARYDFRSRSLQASDLDLAAMPPFPIQAASKPSAYTTILFPLTQIGPHGHQRITNTPDPKPYTLNPRILNI